MPHTTVPQHKLKALLSGAMRDPFSVLGTHPVKFENQSGSAVRVFIPGASRVQIIGPAFPGPIEALEIDPRGFFEAVLKGISDFRPHRLKVTFISGETASFYDCYSFTPVLSEYDLYLWGQGNHFEIYNKLGAHPWEHQGIRGVLFAVWAPSAVRVSVIGEFNQWDGRRHQMRYRGSSGVWELFVPHLCPGTLYKFEILAQEGTILIKSDPFAFYMEQRPKTASIVYDLFGFEWTDQEWMERRARTDVLRQPLAMYEVHLGSWKRGE
ncbi:MAG: 1,4-alpha-glucan branching enzyme, partial [Pseudomonadota bacterium]